MGLHPSRYCEGSGSQFWGPYCFESIEVPLPSRVTFDISMESISNGISKYFDVPMLIAADSALFLVSEVLQDKL